MTEKCIGHASGLCERVANEIPQTAIPLLTAIVHTHIEAQSTIKRITAAADHCGMKEYTAAVFVAGYDEPAALAVCRVSHGS